MQVSILLADSCAPGAAQIHYYIATVQAWKHPILTINLAASPGPPLLLDSCSWMEKPQLLGLAQLYLHSKIILVTFMHIFIHTFCTTRYRSNVIGPILLVAKTTMAWCLKFCLQCSAPVQLYNNKFFTHIAASTTEIWAWHILICTFNQYRWKRSWGGWQSVKVG